MSTMPIGVDFSKGKRADFGPLAEMVGAMREEITREVLHDVLAQRQSLLTDISQIVANAVSKAAPPTVEVRGAENTVNLPEMRPIINVDIPGEDDAGEIEAMDRNTKAVQALTQEVALLRQMLSRPVIKEVERDTNREIIRVTETR